MGYTIYTGCFEKGTREQQSAFIHLFGAENIRYKFNFYFHWYNIAHEYGHCLCSHYQSKEIGLQQELLVNRFAVGIWRYGGYERELNSLNKMLKEILKNIKSPVPDSMSFEQYYEHIWGTESLMEVPIYGYFQFKSVQMALESKEKWTDVLQKMGIRKEIIHSGFPYKQYAVSSQTAKDVLNDLQCFLNRAGIEQPAVTVELVGDPAIHCAKYPIA